MKLEQKKVPRANLKLSKIVISDEYIDQILNLIMEIRDNKFAVGDLLVALVDAHDGRRYEVIRYVAGKINYEYYLLDEYERTARNWTKNKRNPKLTWTHYRNAIPNQDEQLLDIAADKGLSATAFKEAKYPAIVRPIVLSRKMLSIVSKIELDFEDADDGEILAFRDQIDAVLDKLVKIKLDLSKKGY